MKTFLNLGVILVACVIIMLINWHVGGVDLVKNGTLRGLKFLVKIMPMIFLFSLLSGQIESLYIKKPEAVSSIITGPNGIAKAAIAGAIIPGGVASGPTLKSEWDKGGNRLAIISFIFSMSLINWNTLLFRMPFFGEKITAWIYGVGIAIVSLSVIIMMIVNRFWAER